MERQVKKLFHDILESIAAIESYFGNKKVFAEYEKNRLVRRGVERELEIIGEAMKRILEIIPEVEISDSRKVINFRNRISHGYDTIDNTIVWGIVVNHLPLLKSEIEKVLAEDSTS